MNINTRKLALQYSILQGAYWALFCVTYGFATVFLLSRNFNSLQIGIVIAIGNLLGVVMQPVFASIADSSRTMTLHRLIRLLICASALLLLLLYLIPNLFLAVAALFLLTDTLLQVVQPLINSVSVYYLNHGISVDFGMARGIGSVSYAAASALLGILIKRYDTSVIPLLGILLLLVVVLTVSALPILKDEQIISAESTESKANAGKPSDTESMWSFFCRYRRFSITLAGLTLLFTFHNMSCSYLFQITQHLGGDSSAMGTALSIAAVLELPTMLVFSRLIRRFKSSSLLIASGVFFALKALGYVLAGNILQMYLVQILQTGSFALYVPSSVYYVNETMEPRDKFKGQAVMTGTNTLGGVFGSLIGGFILNLAGIEAMLFAELGIAVCGCLLVCFFAPIPAKSHPYS